MKQSFALTVDCEVNSGQSLNYLFSVVCQRSASSVRNCAEAERLLNEGLRPQVLVVSRSKDPDAELDLIKRASTLEDGPFIFAVDWQTGPDFGSKAFLAGANDVFRGPFSIREFALRLEARLGQGLVNAVDLETAPIFDWEDGAFIAECAKLTAIEARIVHTLTRRCDEIVSRDELSQAIDHRPWQYGDRRFDVHVAKIRKKLMATFGSQIEVSTVRALGYQLKVDKVVEVSASDSSDTL